jgi:hypothetical protein
MSRLTQLLNEMLDVYEMSTMRDSGYDDVDRDALGEMVEACRDMRACSDDEIDDLQDEFDRCLGLRP